MNKKELKEASEFARENVIVGNKSLPEYIILDSGEGHKIFLDPVTKRMRYLVMTAREWREMGVNPGDMVPDGELIRFEIKEGPIVSSLQ